MEGQQPHLGDATAASTLTVRILRQFGSALAQLLFPISCIGCGVEQQHLCPACAFRIRGFALEPRCFSCDRQWPATRSCPQCLKNPESISRLFWLGPYPSQLLQHAIHALKYDGRWAIAKPLAQLLAERLLRSGLGAWTIIPIPLSGKRTVERGFNQAEEMGSHIAAATGWCMRSDVFERIRSTSPQAQQQDPDARAANVAGCFAVRAGTTVPERILLVDDVWTTGSTMREACRVLRQAGAREVIGAVIAKG